MAALERSRESRQSPSSIRNRQIVEDQSEDKPESIESQINSTAEDRAWTIIDQEISEWHYVCGTDRPFWWSPEPKDNQSKSSIPSMHGESIQNKEDYGNIRQYYNLENRDLPEAIMNDPNSTDAVATTIALQLLSACFTLAPSSLNSPTAEYTLSSNVPDPRMISSLRMHTHYRYSPSFGHGARNPSPIEGWSTCENLTRSPSLRTIDKQVATPKSFTTASRHSRRRKMQDTSSGSLHHKCPKPVFESTDSTSSQVVDDEPYRKAALALFGSMSMKSKSLASKGSLMKYINDEKVLYQKVLPNMNYSLQPVIRSTPHPVYTQPIRGNVIQKFAFSTSNRL